MKKSKLLFILMILFLPTIWAQEKEINWILLQEQSHLKVYYGIGSCGEMDMMWIKAENTSDSLAFTQLELKISDGNQIYHAGPVMLDVHTNSTLILGCESLPPHIMEHPVIVNNKENFSCELIEPEIKH